MSAMGQFLPIAEAPAMSDGSADQPIRQSEGRALLLCPGGSDVDLLSYRDGIIYLDAQVPHCAFDLGVAKK